MDQTLDDQTLPVNTPTANPSGIMHGFDTGYAKAYGVDEAIMIRNLQFFITINANRGHNLRDGRYWTYDRLEDFVSHFPYWTIQTVRRVLASLIKQQVIIKGEFNEVWSNRTQWYAFKDQDKFIKDIRHPKCPAPLNPKSSSCTSGSDLLKSTTGSCGNQQLTDVGTDNCYKDTSNIASNVSYPSSMVPKEPLAAEAAEVESSVSSKSRREKPDFPPKVRELGNQLINSLTRIKADYVPPKNLAAFLTEVDFILRLDKRDPEKVLDVFNWAIADSFWADKMFKPNPAKYLREKFDQLEMKMNAKPPPNPNQVDRRLRDKDGKTVDDWKDNLF